MDEYHSKKNANGVGAFVRGCRLALGDRNHDPRSSQCCNRLGCSINSRSGSQIENPKHLRSNVCASRGKAIAGSSSRLVASPQLRKIQKRPQTLTSSKEACLAASSHGETFVEIPNSSTSTSEDQPITFEREMMEDSSARDTALLTDNSVEEIGKSPATRIQKYEIPELGNHSLPQVSSSHNIAQLSLSRNFGEPSEAPPHGSGASSSRCDLVSLSCTSISKVLPSRFSVTDTRDSNRIRKSDGNVPSIRERNISNSALHTSSNNVSSRSNLSSLQSTRRTNRPSTLRGVTSVRTRRAPTDCRRLSESSSNNNMGSQSYGGLPAQAQLGPSNNSSTATNSSSLTSMEVPVNSLQSGNEISRRRQTPRHEGSNSPRFVGLSIDRDEHGRFIVEGIAEVLFALERIEQDEELTYEQLLVLETNLLLGGLSFHDQHRELRMNIDNMTYEELLALEERMGSVSTAPSKEALSKSLGRQIFYSLDPAVGGTKTNEEDAECSICQEEYANGDEVGCLPCDHRYHVSCISVWLRLKNWCPICKAPAAPE